MTEGPLFILWDGEGTIPVQHPFKFPRHGLDRSHAFPGKHVFERYKNHWDNWVWYWQSPNCFNAASELQLDELPKEIQLWLLLIEQH